MPENLVDVDAVRYSYGRRPVLKSISMRVPRGKVVAIMGGSGSGKTTLLRLIGGQLRPDSGAVRIAGEDVHALDAQGLYRLRRRTGMLYQFGALFTDLSVFAIIPDYDGISIGVGREVPGIDFCLEKPADVRRWLEQISRTDALAAS